MTTQIIKDLNGLEKEKFDKPGFDARLSFNRQVERYLMTIQQAMNSYDFDSWNINLFGLWSLFNPFIKPSESRDIKKDLDKIGVYLSVNGNNKSFFRGRAIRLLKDVNANLIFSGRHLLMPLGEEGITEFDEDQFLRMANMR